MNAEGPIVGILSDLDELESRNKTASKLMGKAAVEDTVRGLSAGLFCWVLAIVGGLFTFLYIKLFGDGDHLNSPLVTYALYFGFAMGLLGLILMVFGKFIFDSSHNVPDQETLDLDPMNALLSRKILNQLKDYVQGDTPVQFSLNHGGLKPVSSEGRVTNYEQLPLTFSGTLKKQVMLDLSLVFRIKRIQEKYALFKRSGRALIQLPIYLYRPKNHQHFSDRTLPWGSTSRYDFYQSSVVHVRLASETSISRKETSEILEEVVQEKLRPAFPDCEFETSVLDNIADISVTFPTLSQPATLNLPYWNAQSDINRVLKLADILANSRLLLHMEESRSSA